MKLTLTRTNATENKYLNYLWYINFRGGFKKEGISHPGINELIRNIIQILKSFLDLESFK